MRLTSRSFPASGIDLQFLSLSQTWNKMKIFLLKFGNVFVTIGVTKFSYKTGGIFLCLQNETLLLDSQAAPQP